MTFSEFQHSIAMVKLKNVAQRYILQLLQDGIDFLMYNAGLVVHFFFGDNTFVGSTAHFFSSDKAIFGSLVRVVVSRE
ncbi:MAG: hypothetical protein ACI9Y7_002626 [Dokdonia sp.]|jgi:hypothetical protein